MEKEIAISIITPFYQQGEIFWETYHAVNNQTFIAWEWIIVDDGSTDASSVRVLEKLSTLHHPGIRIISHTHNLGLPAARNTGVCAAAAGFVFFLDSDDIIEPDYLEKAWIALTLNQSFSFVNSWSTGFGAKNYDWEVGLEKRRGFIDQNWVAFAGLFRKEMLLKVPFNESRTGGLEDWEFWLGSAANGYWGNTIPEKLFHYRINSADKKWENWDSGKKQKKIKEEFRKRYAGVLEKHFPNPAMSFHSGPFPYPGVFVRPAEKTRPVLLIVLPWLSPGGVEQFTLKWMTALQTKFDYVLVTTNASRKNDNADFKKICPSVFHFAHLSDISLYPVLIDYVIRSRQPDLIVMSHSEPFYHLLPYIRQNHPDLPVTDINHIEDVQWQGGGYPKISSIFSPYIDRHIVISEWLKQFMQNNGVEEGKLETLYINTDTDSIRPLSEKEKARGRSGYHLPEEGTIILFSGRLTHQKNVLLLPDIMEILVKRGLHFTMVVCGDGPDREALEEKIYQKGLGARFSLVGEVGHVQSIRYMQLADIFLLPSAWEGIATVLYEAMAAGLPIIATDVGGQRELLTPDCGILVPQGDAAMLIPKMAEGLEILLKDPVLRSGLAVAARRRVEILFDSKRSFERLYNLFKEVSQEYRPPAPEIKGFVLDEYLDFTRQWNILQSGQSRPAWKEKRFYRAFRKIYKVTRGKRPLSYLWKTG